MFHMEQNQRRANAQPKTIAPIYENKHRHQTPHPSTFSFTQKPMKNKNTARKNCSTWNTAAEIAAFIIICITLGALLGANF